MGAPIIMQQDNQVSSLPHTTTTTHHEATTTRTYTSLIQQHLALFCIENATFLAERFVASAGNSCEAAVYLLALCHYRAHKFKHCHAILELFEKQPTAQMMYLKTKCLVEMQHYGQAEQTLLDPCRTLYRNVVVAAAAETTETPPTSMDEWILTCTPCPIPNGAAGLALLADICRKSHRKQRAITYYQMSLKLDPTLWTSYAALCEMGHFASNPSEVFGVELPGGGIENVNPNLNSATAPPSTDDMVMGASAPYVLSQTPVVEQGSALRAVEQQPQQQPQHLGTPSSLLHNTTTGGRKLSFGVRHSSAARPPPQPPSMQPSLFETPNLTPIPRNNDDDAISRARHVASRLYYEPSPEISSTSWAEQDKSRYLTGLGGSKLSFSTADTPMTTTGSNRQPTRALFLSAQEENTTNETNTIRQETTTEPIKEEADELSENDESGVQDILGLLCILGAGYKNLCMYRCKEALQTFHQLPTEQFHTGWVLHHVGRAYFEIADYQGAKKTLERMQQLEPHRMQGLEVLSTTLWHLKKEVELSHLAQRAVDFDRLSPEAWCIVGNCFSLQKEHETALTFFRRSIQVNPNFTYSHTLSGHEYVANEDFTKAVACYRDAIRIDDRHYNAWYGLGAIYYRQEKYDLAEYHFKRAIALNPQSSVLQCHLGMAQFANGMSYEALETLAQAFALNPRNPQARYQRATIYMTLDRPNEALVELQKVRDAAPRESSVHYAMGKVLKRLGRPEQAMRCFLTALDLDPKDNNLIKSAMDKLDQPDVDEEVSAF